MVSYIGGLNINCVCSLNLTKQISFSNYVLLYRMYFSKSDKGQKLVSYISGGITFGSIIIVLAYHFLTVICFKQTLEGY